MAGANNQIITPDSIVRIEGYQFSKNLESYTKIKLRFSTMALIQMNVAEMVSILYVIIRLHSILTSGIQFRQACACTQVRLLACFEVAEVIH